MAEFGHFETFGSDAGISRKQPPARGREVPQRDIFEPLKVTGVANSLSCG